MSEITSNFEYFIIYFKTLTKLKWFLISPSNGECLYYNFKYLN